MRRRRIAVASGVLALVAALVPQVSTSGAPAARAATGWTTTETMIPSADGTLLHAYIHRPAGLAPDAKTPVSLVVSPYLNSGGGWFNMGGAPDPARAKPFRDPNWPYLVERGYTEVAVEPRGYGSSGGCSDLGGPGEQSDVYAAVEWAGTQPWSTGKVGIFGWSYEGGMAASAVKNKPPHLAAAFLGVPVTSFYRFAETNGINNITGASLYNVPHGFIPPSVNSDSQYLTSYAGSAASDPRCQVEPNVAISTQLEESDPYWAARDYLTTSDVPVFFIGGLQDENVVPQYILPYINTLTGPKRAWIGQWEHGPPAAADWHAEAVRMFDRYVAGKDVDVPSGFVIQDSSGAYRTSQAWPIDEKRDLVVPLKPGSYRELEFTQGDGEANDFWPPMGAIPPEPAAPAIHWAAVSQPMPQEVHISGEAVMRVEVDIELPQANVVVTVLDIGTDNKAHYMTRGAYLARGDGTLTFNIFPQDWLLEPGHRVGVVVSGASSVHYNAGNRWLGLTGGEVRVKGGSLTFPALARRTVPCTSFDTKKLFTDVIYRLSEAERTGAAVTASVPPPYRGERRCS